MSLVDSHLKQEIVDCCRRSVQCGLNFNTQGNISVRVPATGLIAITPTGLEYDRMTADDIVVVDASGRRVEGERQPSSQTDVHLVVYRRRSDINAVVHTEPVYANVFGVLGRPVEAVLINMVIYSRGPVPVMPFMPSNSTEFGEAMVKVLGERNAVIWGNHGLMTVGARPDQRVSVQRGRGDRRPGTARRALHRAAPGSQLRRARPGRCTLIAAPSGEPVPCDSDRAGTGIWPLGRLSIVALVVTGYGFRDHRP